MNCLDSGLLTDFSGPMVVSLKAVRCTRKKKNTQGLELWGFSHKFTSKEQKGHSMGTYFPDS